MLRYYTFLFLLLCGKIFSQNVKMKIIDSESLNPIKNVRILSKSQLFYTNDDGFAIVPETLEKYEISAPNYQTENIEKFKSEVRLKRGYKMIDEVKITNIDIKDIFNNVLRNYSNIYYDKPSLYDIIYKQKNFYDNTLAFLVIADAKLWSKTNQYNFRQGLNKNFDEILQIQLNSIKHISKNRTDSIFTGKTSEFSHEIVGNYFFNYELSRLMGILKSGNNKSLGTLTSQEGSSQFINFRIKAANGTNISGNFTYNTLNKAISRFEVSYDQSEFPILKKTSVDGRQFDYKMGIASIIFEFYVKDGKYIPSQYNFSGDDFIVILDGQKHTKKFNRQITYNTFTPSDNIGLNPKIDLVKDFWENFPNNEQKPDAVILSEEEANFLNITK